MTDHKPQVGEQVRGVFRPHYPEVTGTVAGYDDERGGLLIDVDGQRFYAGSETPGQWLWHPATAWTDGNVVKAGTVTWLRTGGLWTSGPQWPIHSDHFINDLHRAGILTVLVKDGT